MRRQTCPVFEVEHNEHHYVLEHIEMNIMMYIIMYIQHIEMNI